MKMCNLVPFWNKGGIRNPNTMRPMLAKFPPGCYFGICKAASLASPCNNNRTKIFRRIGSVSLKRTNFLQEKAKAELIVCLLTSILTHYCDKFAFLNRMGFGSLMPVNGQRTLWHLTQASMQTAICRKYIPE